MRLHRLVLFESFLTIIALSWSLVPMNNDSAASSLIRPWTGYSALVFAQRSVLTIRLCSGMCVGVRVWRGGAGGVITYWHKSAQQRGCSDQKIEYIWVFCKSFSFYSNYCVNQLLLVVIVLLVLLRKSATGPLPDCSVTFTRFSQKAPSIYWLRTDECVKDLTQNSGLVDSDPCVVLAVG